jgi:hypothetical protein
MMVVGRFTSVPSLSEFSMFETPKNADIVPLGFSFLRNGEARGHTKDEARDDLEEIPRHPDGSAIIIDSSNRRKNKAASAMTAENRRQT